MINCISSPIGRKKLGELWSTNQKVIDTHVQPPNWTFFRETIIRPLGGAGPSNFYTPYNSLKCISSRTWGTGWPHVGLCPIFLVIYSTVAGCKCEIKLIVILYAVFWLPLDFSHYASVDIELSCSNDCATIESYTIILLQNSSGNSISCS